jgi:hypothetical protein
MHRRIQERPGNGLVRAVFRWDLCAWALWRAAECTACPADKFGEVKSVYNHSYALSVIDPRWTFYAPDGSRQGSVLHPMAAQDNATKRGVVHAGPLNPQNHQVHAMATWEDSMRQHYALHHARKSCIVCPPGTWAEGKTGQIKCISKPKLVQHCAADECMSLHRGQIWRRPFAPA